MKLCPACDRHLFGPEPACPFCGAAQATTPARPSGGALASLGLVLTLGTAACGPITEPGQSEGSSTSSDDTGPPSTSTTMSTTGGTTVEPTTTDGPAMTTIEASSSSGSDDNPCAFYAGCPPDVSTDPYECDVFAQDCPEGEKCMPWANDGGESWNATRCVPVAPDPGTEGEPCTVEGNATSGLDTCDVGLMCFDLDPRTNEGTCYAQCIGTAEEPYCESPEQACQVGGDGSIALCYDVCDPLDPVCDPGWGCYYQSPGFTCQQAAPDPAAHGEECLLDGECASAHACTPAALVPACTGVSCCAELCDTTSAIPCPDADLGVACQPWYEPGEAPPGYENVGVCTLPP